MKGKEEQGSGEGRMKCGLLFAPSGLQNEGINDLFDAVFLQRITDE